jgi:predicted DNA-binding transcriptional regulator AlpA
VNPPEPLATPQEVAGFLRKPVKTLTNWRSLGTGPKYRKVGRDVRYDWADVRTWYDQQPASATA